MEIILVDDHSTKEFLKQKLDDYIAINLPKVKVIRLPERSGLITARLEGAKAATGDVLIFLDSHTEANTNWLPPLLGKKPLILEMKPNNQKTFPIVYRTDCIELQSLYVSFYRCDFIRHIGVQGSR